MHATAPSDYDVLIVGAGISGIGMATQLVRQCPQLSFRVIERRAAIGGTWDLFRYPGVRSDSDMFTLGYGHTPWTEAESIAEAGKIRRYLARVVADNGIAGRITFDTTVASADWDSHAARWTLSTSGPDGQPGALRGRFLFIGAGYYDYDHPHDAAIPGLDSFAGEVIHPQFWPAGFDHAGKRIVVIGSGATAATVVPALAESAAHVTMLQRTPTYYIIRPARDGIANALRRLFGERLGYALTRIKNTRLQDMFIRRSRRQPEAVRDFLEGQVRDELGAAYDPRAFSPPYDPWDQRVCLVPDADLFAAIRDGRADVVTGTIERVEPDGVRLADGRLIAADAIVTATGLRLATLGKIAVSLDGAPVDFSQRYYYRNCMFSNVPNLAALFGYLNAAWTLRVDMVSDWLCRLFNQMEAWDAEVVTPVLADDHDLVDDDPFWGFTSGYLERGRQLIPKSATTAPWRLSMDYFADRAEMREAPIDDGILRFERARETA